MRVRARLAIALAALLAGTACLDSPYANIAEILDTTQVVAGKTWIAAVQGASGPETRLLVLAYPDSTTGPAFIFTSVVGIAPVRKLVGQWVSDGAGDVTFDATTEYVMANEASTPVTARTGSLRRSVGIQQTVAARLEGGKLVLSGGDGTFDGRYAPLGRALARLPTATAADMGCVFQVFNLTVLSSQVRIIGFNSAGTAQYLTPATFVGESAGSLVISVSNLLSPLTDITFTTFSDFEEMEVVGTQWTQVNMSGNGHMYGTLTFTFHPAGPGGEPLAAIEGTVGYGIQGGGGDSIQLTNGNVTGGSYAVAVTGSGSGLVTGPTAPQTPVAACLGL